MKIRILCFFACSAVALGLALFWWTGHQGSSDSSRRVSQSFPKAKSTANAAGKKTTAAEIFDKIKNNEASYQLTPEQLAAYVEKKHHSLTSLLTAWQLGRDKKWLDEAAESEPDNPRVALAELESDKLSPEDRKEWIARLQQNDPQNALGWCYEAADAFKEGRTEEGKAALMDAGLSKTLDTYFKQKAQGNVDAYLSAGFDPLTAEVVGRAYVPVPELSLVANLARVLKTMDNPDPDSVSDLMGLARLLRSEAPAGQSLIYDLVGMSVESVLLGKMNEFDPVPGSDKLVTDRMTDLTAEKNLIKELVAQSEPLIPTLTDSELRQYLRRTSVEGELKALQWVIQTKRAR